MQLLLILASFCSVSAIIDHGRRRTTNHDVWSEFKNFIHKYDRNYSSDHEMQTRFEIFKENFLTIIAHNSDSTQNFTMGVNRFADLTSSEFRSIYLSGFSSSIGAKCKQYTISNNVLGLPDSIDWRSYGAVTPVKDQGQCGSCWSFSSTGALEGEWAIISGELVSFSEQQLVDCANGMEYSSHGCNGGQMDGAFKYAIENGICTESDYPYVSGETKTAGSCKACKYIAKFSYCSDVESKNQVSLKNAVAQQPVSVAIEADTRYFQFYTSGVITSEGCGTNLDHGVLTVGYGSEDGIDYWLVKNSWGESWGEQGYVKIARSDKTNDAGICGIAMMASFPSV